MTISKTNPLLATDVYKMGHMEQYVPGCTRVYSYLTTRSDKTFKEIKWFGLRYYLQEYLSTPLTLEMGEEFIGYAERILGKISPEIKLKITQLCQLGYFPLEIKAPKEGEIIGVHNVLLTITNTHPDFYWVVGFVESLLLKVWYSCTVASCSLAYRRLVDEFFDESVDEDQYFLKDYTVHDFGYRGDSSEESAAISGAAHLLNFKGSDTVCALPFLDKYYPEFVTATSMGSVPATEHSVMCSYGQETEIKAFERMLELYPSGIVSLVSDTYDLWNVLENYTDILKEKILNRDGKVVFRPDSGFPPDIIMKSLKILADKFGTTTNSKGYKLLNPKIGLIYGDGLYLERYQDVLERMEKEGFAASNLVIGVGGILRNHSRDTLGFTIKASYIEIGDKAILIAKDPITDSNKKSDGGCFELHKNASGKFFTKKDLSFPANEGELHTAFKDGKVLS